MKALIIAAGDGTRLQKFARGRHKCLLPLLGLKVIERVILSAKEAGIYEFVIVTGYRGQDLRKALGGGEKYGVSIQFVENKDWQKANGISVLKAKGYFQSNFALLMSDHIFNPKTLIEIQRLKLKDKECALAVDRTLGEVPDILDTTKATVKSGKVIKLGKNLEEYNAYDTGMFICSPYIFNVLARTTTQGKNSLSDGMRILAKENRLRALDIKGKFWADCDTEKDLKFAEKVVLGSLTKEADGVVSQNFNRKISKLVSKILIRFKFTPNQITVLNLLLAFSAAVLLAKGRYPEIFVGGLLIQFVSIFDGCDGEIARLRFMGTQWGAWFDGIMDKYVDILIMVALAYGHWLAEGDAFIWIIMSFTVLGLLLDGYMPNKYIALFKRELKWWGLNFKRDSRLLILAIGAMTNQILPAFVLLLVLTHFMVLARLISGKYQTVALAS